MREPPVWAQAESETVRRMWVDAWGLLEDAAPTIRLEHRGPAVATRGPLRLGDGRRLGGSPQEGIDAVGQGPGLPVLVVAAPFKLYNPTTCPLCGHPIGEPPPEPPPQARRRLQALPGGKGAASE